MREPHLPVRGELSRYPPIYSANILALNHLNEYSSLDYSVLKPYTFPETSKTGFL